MPTWLIWTAAIDLADLAIIAFIRGADTRRGNAHWS